jgi:hypothetical protein
MQNKRVFSDMSMYTILEQPNEPRLRQYPYMY